LDQSNRGPRQYGTAAFTQLYERYAAHIYRYLLARVNNTHDAQDLTAQTFAAALQNSRQYRGEGSVAAWLTVIARNTAVNFYRQQRRDLPLEEDLPHSSPPPEEVVSVQLRLAALQAAIKRLPADRAEVIRLRIFGELSTAETAALMGKSEAAVKMLLHRALGDLREQLSEEEGE
jgi:RNA polymerase sigma-70 factor, ECF subfamily